MQRREEHAIQERHVLHIRVKHGNVQVSKMYSNKPFQSQRRVAWQCRKIGVVIAWILTSQMI